MPFIEIQASQSHDPSHSRSRTEDDDRSTKQQEASDSQPAAETPPVDATGTPDSWRFYFVSDRAGTICRVSSSVSCVGFSPQQVVGRNWREFVDTENPANAHIAEFERERFKGAGTHRYRCEIVNGYGQPQIVELETVGMLDENGAVIENHASVTIVEPNSERVAQLAAPIHQVRAICIEHPGLVTEAFADLLPSAVARTVVSELSQPLTSLCLLGAVLLKGLEASPDAETTAADAVAKVLQRLLDQTSD